MLFTDIEGSTRLLQGLGRDAYVRALEQHRCLLRDAFTSEGGVEVEVQGDSFHFVFAHARDALLAAAAGQRALAEHAWESEPIRVRIGIHVGEPVISDNLYAGLDVHRAARLMSAGHGGQVLVSEATRGLVESELPSELSLRPLGTHRLKDLLAPERIYQFGDGNFPPLKTLNQSNLPAQGGLMVGRERELREVLELLAVRTLVTLTGAGGSGKTRLALQVAAEAAEDYPDGVWFISLAALKDASLIESSIGQVLGARGELGEFLCDKKLLLLLDNLEQLLPEAAPTVAALDAQVLATSRERLNVFAEQEYPVPTLPPEEAVTLFVQRARRIKPDYQSDQYVVEIVHRLDGLPLAIELAAARVKVLSPRRILERLGHSLDLLTAGTRDSPERQRTLRATIDWSYRLLDDQEQMLFARLAVFAGSFDLDAAAAVGEVDLDTLQALVEKSLLMQAGQGRFFMLETIREFALERLRERCEERRSRKRHAVFFEARAQAAKLELIGPEQGECLRQLDDDLDNVRTALTWTLETGAHELGLRLASALRQFWWIRNHSLEGSHYLESLIEATTSPSRGRLEALQAAAILRVTRGDFVQARAFATEALMLARQAGDDAGLVRALADLAAVEMAGGDERVAIELYEESRILGARVDDRLAVAAATHNLANLALTNRDYVRAATLAEEALGMAKSLGHMEGMAGSLEVLGLACLGVEDDVSAQEHLCASLELTQELGFESGAAYAIGALGAAAIRRGEHRKGVRLIAAAQAFLAEAGVRVEPAERQVSEAAIADAQELLGPDEFRAAWTEGSETELGAAAQEALA
jgi:predicted ATPase